MRVKSQDDDSRLGARSSSFKPPLRGGGQLVQFGAVGAVGAPRGDIVYRFVPCKFVGAGGDAFLLWHGESPCSLDERQHGLL